MRVIAGSAMNNTVKDVRRHGYQTDDRQDQGDIV